MVKREPRPCMLGGQWDLVSGLIMGITVATIWFLGVGKNSAEASWPSRNLHAGPALVRSIGKLLEQNACKIFKELRSITLSSCEPYNFRATVYSLVSGPQAL